MIKQPNRENAEAIIQPSVDTDTWSLEDFVDPLDLQMMLDSLYSITEVPSAIVNLAGDVLAHSGWQDICIDFHRVHPTTLSKCNDCLEAHVAGLAAKGFQHHRCPNGLNDMTTPIIMVDETRVGSVFIGQFFFEDETIDYDRFRSQAQRYGFDEQQYLEALERVPRLHRDLVAATMKFYSRMSGMIASISYSRAQLARKSRMHKKAEQETQMFKTLSDEAMHGTMLADLGGKLVYVNPYLAHRHGYTPEQLIGEHLSVLGKEEQTAEVENILVRLLASGSVSPVELWHTHQDGTLFPVLLSGVVVKDPEKTPQFIAITVVDITEQKQMQRLLQARLNLMEFALDHSLKEVLQKTLDEACELTQSAIGFYHFVDDDEKHLTLTAWSTQTLQKFCSAQGVDTHYSVDQAGVWVDCVRQRKPIIHNDYESLSHRQGLPEGHAPVTRELVVPIMRQGRIVAILGVGNKTQDYFQKDVDTITYFADVAWEIAERKQAEQEIEYIIFHDALTGLYNRRFYEEELRRLDVSRTLPFAILIVDVNGLKLINDAFGQRAGDELLCDVAQGLQSSCEADDIIARIGGDEFIVLLPNTNESSVRQLAERILQGLAQKTVKELPISVSLGWGLKTNIDQDMAAVFRTAEDQMYQHKISDHGSQRHQSIHLIMQTVHAKTPREQQHSERVSQLCRGLAIAMGLDQREINELTTAGVLHDIGKIAIDNHVLDKNGSLTASEWEQIKRHPEIGYNVLGTAPDYAVLAESVLAHHERWDGSGYPHGLRGAAIPIQARIIGIADAYDAMVSDRPYRKGMHHEDAVAEICRCSGSQFDPAIAAVFLDMMADREVAAAEDV